MTENNEKRTFGYNLSYYVAQSGKEQKQVAKELDFSHTTFNTWCKGKVIPSMGKVQKICDYFGIGKTDLLEPMSKGKSAAQIIHKFDQLTDSNKNAVIALIDSLLSGQN